MNMVLLLKGINVMLSRPDASRECKLITPRGTWCVLQRMSIGSLAMNMQVVNEKRRSVRNITLSMSSRNNINCSTDTALDQVLDEHNDIDMTIGR